MERQKSILCCVFFYFMQSDRNLTRCMNTVYQIPICLKLNNMSQNKTEIIQKAFHKNAKLKFQIIQQYSAPDTDTECWSWFDTQTDCTIAAYLLTTYAQRPQSAPTYFMICTRSHNVLTCASNSIYSSTRRASQIVCACV